MIEESGGEPPPEERGSIEFRAARASACPNDASGAMPVRQANNGASVAAMRLCYAAMMSDGSEINSPWNAF